MPLEGGSPLSLTLFPCHFLLISAAPLTSGPELTSRPHHAITAMAVAQVQFLAPELSPTSGAAKKEKKKKTDMYTYV